MFLNKDFSNILARTILSCALVVHLIAVRLAYPSSPIIC